MYPLYFYFNFLVTRLLKYFLYYAIGVWCLHCDESGLLHVLDGDNKKLTHVYDKYDIKHNLVKW